MGVERSRAYLESQAAEALFFLPDAAGRWRIVRTP
jgi:hypothetical protein